MDKIDRLFDAIEHPERFSAPEIEEMLRDPEVKEAFEVLNKMKSSLKAIPAPDIENEWCAFENAHREAEPSRRPWPVGFISRNAAASIAVGLASFTAIATIVGVGVHSFTRRSEPAAEIEMSAETDSLAVKTTTAAAVEFTEQSIPETVVFDEENLEIILNRIAAYYGYKLTFNNNTAKSLRLYYRWNQALPIEEVVESLGNFEQISLTIKNDTITVE